MDLNSGMHLPMPCVSARVMALDTQARISESGLTLVRTKPGLGLVLVIHINVKNKVRPSPGLKLVRFRGYGPSGKQSVKRKSVMITVNHSHSDTQAYI